MIDINSIITSFTKEEINSFISFLDHKNKRKDTKNIELAKLIRNGITDTEEICQTLYKTNNRNAYHALKNRLLHSLIDYTANKNLENENSVEMQLIKYLLASRTFLLQKKYNIAYKILDKAESLAADNLFYPILNEIYHTKIQYASEYPKIDLELLIKKQNKNRKRHQTEDDLNNVYAKLKASLNAINTNSGVVNFESILHKVLKSSNITLNETLSFKSLYQILHIANMSAFVTRKYHKIENFVLKSYQILKQKKETNQQLFYQIEIVYIISNVLFRNRKFDKATQFIKEMEQLMLLNNKQYHQRFFHKKILIEALLLNFTNNPKEAISKIENIVNKKHNDIEAVLDLKLCLIMFYFQQEDIKSAKSVLAKFYHTDNWYIQKSNINWVIKKNLLELILYAETKEEDLFFSRLKSFEKRYTLFLKENNEEQTLAFVKIIEQYFKKPKIIENSDFKTRFEKTFSTQNIAQEDIFDLSFYAWLNSKIKNTSVYETTLKLME